MTSSGDLGSAPMVKYPNKNKNIIKRKYNMKTFSEYINEASAAFKVLKYLKLLYTKNQSAKTFQDIMKKPEYFVYSINKDTFKFGTEKSIGTGTGVEKSIESVEKITGMKISDFTKLLDNAGMKKV